MDLNKLINESNNIVFFGGAGTSTESGIPDFRSVDGLYNMKYKYRPETILSSTFFHSKTKEFYEFYHDKMIVENVEPNFTHYFLAELEKKGKLKGIITQNIDGLHQLAGSKKVIELHGSIHRNYCLSCHASYDLDYIKKAQGIPKCERCGHIVKPDVVLYEEGLDNNNINEAIRLISEADVLIVGGTSLNVYPAAGLIDFYKKDKLVLINKSTTPLDNKANYIYNDSISKVLKDIKL